MKNSERCVFNKGLNGFSILILDTHWHIRTHVTWPCLMAGWGLSNNTLLTFHLSPLSHQTPLPHNYILQMVFCMTCVCVCVCVCVWLGLMCFRTKAIIIFIYNGNQASIIFTVIPSLLTLSPPFSNYITALLYQFLSFSPSFILSLILCDHSSALSVLYKPYNSIPTLTPLTLLFRRIGVKLGFIICQFNNK